MTVIVGHVNCKPRRIGDNVFELAYLATIPENYSVDVCVNNNPPRPYTTYQSRRGTYFKYKGKRIFIHEFEYTRG